jgi:hypothetical protein
LLAAQDDLAVGRRLIGQKLDDRQFVSGGDLFQGRQGRRGAPDFHLGQVGLSEAGKGGKLLERLVLGSPGGAQALTQVIGSRGGCLLQTIRRGTHRCTIGERRL